MAGWVKKVMGIKEWTDDEHWVFYVNVESLDYTAETNFTLYINLNLKSFNIPSTLSL